MHHPSHFAEKTELAACPTFKLSETKTKTCKNSKQDLLQAEQNMRRWVQSQKTHQVPTTEVLQGINITEPNSAKVTPGCGSRETSTRGVPGLTSDCLNNEVLSNVALLLLLLFPGHIHN